MELFEFADFMAYDMLQNDLPDEIITDSHTLSAKRWEVVKIVDKINIKVWFHNTDYSEL